MVEKIITMFFLGIGSVLDLKERKIPVLLCVAFGTLGGIITICRTNHSYGEFLEGIVLGFCFIGISVISKERIGMGDGLVILVLGILLGGQTSLQVVLWGLIFSSVVSVVAIIFFRKKGSDSFPFIPFLFLGMITELFCR